MFDVDSPQLHSELQDEESVAKMLHQIQTENINTPQINQLLLHILKKYSHNESILELVSNTMSCLCGRIAQGSITQEFRFSSFTIALKEGTFDTSDLGFQTWYSSIYMAELIDEGQLIPVVGKNVLEIGSGTGLAGMTSAKKGASITMLTDYHPQVLKTLQENLSLNRLENAFVKELDWTRIDSQNFNDLDPMVESTRWDTILAADCIYTREHSRLVPLIVDKYLGGNVFHVVLQCVIDSWRKSRNS